MVKLGAARIAENGTVNGVAGDQTGREVCVKPAYMHKNGWQIIRAKNVPVAIALAWLMAIACSSREVGYSQKERYLIFWTNIKNNVPTNCDCSSLVDWCVQQSGITNFDINGFYTGNEVSRLVGTGQFDVLPCNSIDDMCIGDILVEAKGTAHTEIVVDGKARLSGNYFDEPEPDLYHGCKGAEVRKLQEFFNRFCGTNLKIDDDFGDKTKFALVCFQTAWGLAADGIYGDKSHTAVCFVLWCNNVQAV